MFLQNCVCQRLEIILLIVCSPHFCNTWLSLAPQSLTSSLPFLLVPFLLPLPRQRGWGGGVGRNSSCWEVHLQPKSPLKSWSVILELALHFSQRHHVDLKWGSSECMQSHTPLFCHDYQETSLSLLWQSPYVAAQRAPSLGPCTQKSLIRANTLHPKKINMQDIKMTARTDEALRELPDFTVLVMGLRIEHKRLHDAGTLKHIWPCY